MQAITAHEFAAQHNCPFKEFKEFNKEFVAALLAEIHIEMPDVRELLFHGHELRQPSPLRIIRGTGEPASMQTFPESSSAQPDQWIYLDLQVCSNDDLIEAMRPYESGMIYVPTSGSSALALGQLLIQQTCGLDSLFRPKTYQKFLALDVFMAIGNGYYALKDRRA